MTELIRSLKPGNADNAAEEFGRTSIGLEFGHAYGYNIVTGFGEVPTRDLAAIYVRTAGIEGAFLMDATSYAWDANGLVISSDLSLVGVTGYVGATRPASSWLRLPVSTAGLNAAPTPVEGVASKANSIAIPAGFNPANPASVAAALAALPVDGADSFRSTQNNTEPIGPFLESERHELFTGSVAVVIDYEYPLLLPTETFSLSTGVVAEDGFSDQYIASVSLLLHMDGTNESTTFVDSSANSLPITAEGSAMISTAQSKYSGASGAFNGADSSLLISAGGMEISVADFTVECWIYTTDGAGYRPIISMVPGTYDNTFYVYDNTLTWYDGNDRCQSAPFADNVWHHAAVTRSGGTVRVFLNGVQSATTYTSTASIGDNAFRVAADSSAYVEFFSGYIDELRITVGVARYTASFTPPSAPFPNE